MGRATRVATESTWIQLNGPNRGCREVIQNELAARRAMRVAQIHPVARAPSVRFKAKAQYQSGKGSGNVDEQGDDAPNAVHPPKLPRTFARAGG